MYIYDAFLQIGAGKNRETFNFWTARNFVRLSAETKPELGEVIRIETLEQPYEVVGFSQHKPSELEPVLDIVKLKLLP